MYFLKVFLETLGFSFLFPSQLILKLEYQGNISILEKSRAPLSVFCETSVLENVNCFWYIFWFFFLVIKKKKVSWLIKIF